MVEDVKFGEYGKITFICGMPMCHICGKTFNKLGAHSWMVHQILTKDYREMFGLCNNTRLMCDESIETARLNWEANKDKQVINLNKGIETRWIKGDERIIGKRKLCKEHLDKCGKIMLENNKKKKRNKNKVDFLEVDSE